MVTDARVASRFCLAPLAPGTNAAHQALRLFKTTWENPRPDVPIETLDFISQMTVAAPFVLAITAEP